MGISLYDLMQFINEAFRQVFHTPGRKTDINLIENVGDILTVLQLKQFH
jgi:hypothetical protein